MKRIAFLCALSCATMAGAEETSDARVASHVFGALAIDHDPAVWRVEDETTIARWEEDRRYHVVTLEVLPADAAPCSTEAMEERARGSFGLETIGRGPITQGRVGFDIHVGIVDLGCRNWAGAPVAACAVVDGRLHLMTSSDGCHLHHTNAERVLELLEGVRLK